MKGEKVSIITSSEPLSNRLQLIEQKFVGFRDGLLAQRDKKLGEQEAKFKELESGIKHISECLRTITAERIQAFKDAQEGNITHLGDWFTEYLETNLNKIEKVTTILMKAKERLSKLYEKHKDMMKNLEKQTEVASKKAAEQLTQFQKDYGQAVREYKSKGDDIVNTMREKDKLFHKKIKKEGLLWKEDQAKIVKEIETQRSERQVLGEAFRQAMEPELCTLIKSVKKENKQRNEQREEFLQNIEHFTKRLRSSIKGI